MTWDFSHRWYMPFAWIALSSIISVPWAIYLQHGMTMHPGVEIGLPYGNDWAIRSDVLKSFLPYTLNLGCAIWLFERNGSTRWAAAWALAAGMARLIVPIALVSMSDVSLASGQHYIDWRTLRVVLWFDDVQMFALGMMLWVVFGHFVGQTGGEAAPQAAYAEAH